ncbi:hypothetical protein EON63_03440 [archaeon]|nr:MAG: hypothetical protein EON63_03440 [archaeon]
MVKYRERQIVNFLQRRGVIDAEELRMQYEESALKRFVKAIDRELKVKNNKARLAVAMPLLKVYSQSSMPLASSLSDTLLVQDMKRNSCPPSWRSEATTKATMEARQGVMSSR